MGILKNLKEVLKELKHKRLSNLATKFCPKCKSSNIRISSSFNMGGIAPVQYFCEKCGYNGPITIELDTDDNSGVQKADFYVDDELRETSVENPFEWYMNLRLLGKHTLQVIVYDHAGNTKSESMTATIYNFFGSR